MKKLFGLIILLFLVVGCSTSQVEPTSTPSPLPSTETSTPTLTPTSTQSNTPSPTPIPLKLPVLNGTPVPLSNISISVNNADKVTELARYWGNPDSVVRVTRDGKTLVMANVEGIYFYDIPSGALLKTIDAHIYFFHFDKFQPLSTYVGHYIAISSDAKRLAYLDENLFVHVIDVQDNKVFNLDAKPKNPDDIPRMNLELSPDGKTLAITIAGSVQYGERMLLYDVDSGQQLPVNDVSTNVCFTGDGKYLIVEPKIIYATSDWQKITPIATKFDTFVSFACDPISSRFAILSGKDIEVWDIASGQSTAAFRLPDAVALNPQNELISVIHFSSDGTKLITFDRYLATYYLSTYAGLVDIASGQILDKIYSVSPAVYTVDRLDALPTGKLKLIAAGINTSSMPRFDAYYFSAQIRDATIFNFTGSGTSQRVLVSSMWSNFACEITMMGNSNCPYAGPFSVTGHLWANGHYYAFNYVGKAKLFEGLKIEGNPLIAIPYNAFPDDRKIIAYSGSNNVMLYMATYGPPDNRLVLYDITNDKSISNWKIPSRTFSYGIISPSGRYAAILLTRNGTSDQVMVYDLETKQLIVNEILKDSFENIEPSLAFSADDKTLAMLSPEFDSGKKSWNMSIHVLHMDGHSKPVQYDVFLPSTNFPIQGAPAMGFAVSPDSKLVAVGTNNGAVYMIDTSNGNLVHEIPPHQAHTGPILSLTFNEDGSLLASLERSGIVKIWGIAP